MLVCAYDGMASYCGGTELAPGCGYRLVVGCGAYIGVGVGGGTPPANGGGFTCTTSSYDGAAPVTDARTHER